MPKLFSLSRAARLAGVSRGELQKRIREEDIKTFEGKLTVELLLQLYPHIDLESDPVLERVRRIRTEAKPKSHYSDGWMPDPKVLMSRLKEFQHTLVQTKSALNASEFVMQETLDDLRTLLQAEEEHMRNGVRVRISLLEKEMKRLERVEDARAALFAKDALMKLVSASIRLLPSGHEFFLEGSESILDAGLKAGLYIDYGCSSGNCGACKCRVLSGAVSKLCEHDYVLSARERDMGYILACSNTAISDLVIEATEAGMGEDLPYQEIRATIRQTEPIGETMVLLQVQTPRTQSLRFKAGQQIKLTLEDESSADLCIASCPCDGRNLQFLVGQAPRDAFHAAVLADNLSRQTVLLQGPTGNFVLQDESSDPLLFVGKGTGFAPIKSLIEQAVAIDDTEGIQLVLVGGNPAGSTLDNLCRAWRDSLDNFVYTATDPDCTAEELAALIAASNSGTARIQVYLAGPSDWLDELVSAARGIGLAVAAWHHWAVD